MANHFTLAELIIKVTSFQESIIKVGKSVLSPTYDIFGHYFNITSFTNGLGRGECHVAWGGGEHSKFDNIEVLTNPNGANFIWVNAVNLPSNAVRGGRTNERETIYVIQCQLQSGDQTVWMPGKFIPSTGAYTSYGGQEIRCAAVQFLACNN